ncbi:anthranilate phosphoribosyltransferase [Evansella vedderi]|uniref:Anthranilate phosphoribosyltransferase n=1 Tax=Evansella vedderi TaxID=38282 RepID=A0ABT9ZZD7_9BACI|nr:anthranilate phosphoribosyltransferase [Evansella vedderi]MDQ0256609.1 anthranilate phosphoribosyltransferase [Evansella vedderi]
MKEWIKIVARGKKNSRDLTYEQALEAAKTIAAGEATEAQVAAFLVAQRLKTESVNEVLAFTKSFRDASETIPLKEGIRERCIDFAGAYTGRNTFAATIPVSILLAANGLPVYFHSSDSLPPRNGVSLKDIVTQLGIETDLSSEQVGRSIEQVNIGFGWTEKFVPPLAAIRSVREEIGVRSFINTVEKLLNLTGSTRGMTGIFHKTVVDLNASLIEQQGFQEGYIVQGVEGTEDLPVYRKSIFYEVKDEKTRSFQVDPKEYGFCHKREEEKENLTAAEQARLIRSILEGDNTEAIQYYRDQVLLNAGIRYYLFGVTETIDEGIEGANTQLEQQKGADHLEKWRHCVEKELVL